MLLFPFLKKSSFLNFSKVYFNFCLSSGFLSCLGLLCVFLISCSEGGSKRYKVVSNVSTLECERGKVRDKEATGCRLPQKGHYASSSGEESPCTDIPNKEAWLETPAESLVEDKCPFTCKAYYIKDEQTRGCNPPAERQYIDAGGAVRGCTDSIENSAVIGGQAVAVNTSDQCPFTCKPGYVKDSGARTCKIPLKGKYANALGVAVACDAIEGERGGFEDFKENIWPVDTADGCNFTCNAGYKKDEVARTCVYPDSGKYVDAQGEQQDCPEISNSVWVTANKPVSLASECVFSCTGDALLNSLSWTCDLPGVSFWYDPSNAGKETLCTPIQNQKGWLPSSSGTPLTSDSCDFACRSGYKKGTSPRACSPPTEGTYVQADCISEAPCLDISNKQAWVEGPADSETSCDFTCLSGFEKYERTCRSPLPGFWVDAGVVKPCDPIAKSDWSANTGAVTSATGCAFSCKSGFTESGRSCNLPADSFIAIDGTAQSCGDAPESSMGWVADQSGVSRQEDCKFVCDTGRTVTGKGSSGSCDLLLGYFTNSSAANSAGASCGALPVGSTNWAADQSGVSRQEDCKFTCDSKYRPKGTGSGGSCVPKIQSVSERSDHICVLFKDGSVKCWGRNDYGQINAGDLKMLDLVDIPLGGASAIAIATSRLHTCVVLFGGAIKCWGNNGYRQTGSADTSFTGMVDVNLGGANATLVVTGNQHSCALLSDKSVKCWGDNQYGQTGSKDRNFAVVVDVPLGGAKVIDIKSGNFHTCALLEDKSLKCWGRNSNLQKGGGAAKNFKGMVDVSLGGVDVTDFGLGESHTCVFLKSGGVKCWGQNLFGQTSGRNKYIKDMADVDLGGATVTAITVGSNHTCVLLEDKSVKCWGDNSFGQLGNTEGAKAIVDVDLGGAKVASIAAGRGHTCVTFENDEMRCWGHNSYGQIGDGRVNLGQNQAGQARIATILAGGESNNCCAILDDHSVKCWGLSYYGQTSTNSFNLGQTLAVQNQNLNPLTKGRDHVCLILSDGRVKCWGDNSRGQTGSADKSFTGMVDVNLGGTTAIALTSSAYHTCALLTGGSVKCWGKNLSGQTGGADKSATGMVDVNLGGATATAIDTGLGHTCVILDDKSVKCWGLNDVGQTGGADTSTTGMVDAPLLSGDKATAIALGDRHSCVLLEDKSLKCWGNNEDGQTSGSDTSSASGTGIVTVPLDGASATTVVAGGNHSCAILSSGSVKCWGYNQYNQIGSTDLFFYGIVDVDLGGASATGIAAGNRQTCVILSSGEVKCWGYVFSRPIDQYNLKLF